MPATVRSKSLAAALITLLICIAEFKPQSSVEVTPPDQKISEAQQAMDRAGKLRASWTKAFLQEAINEYDKAALLWTSMSDFANASQATLNAGDVYFLFSDYREALKKFQQAETLAEKADGWLAKANALSRIGRLQSFVGNNELALRQLNSALELFNQHEANRSEVAANAHGETLGNLAEVNYARGDFLRSREQFKSALELIHNDPRKAAKIHIFNGYIAGSLGDSDKAKNEISQAQKLYSDVNDKIGEAQALTAMGLFHSHKSEHARAIELHKSAIEIFRDAGDRHSEAVALNALGTSYGRNNKFDLALNHHKQALRLFEEIGSVEGISAAALELAMIYRENNRLDDALALCKRSLQLSRTVGDVRTEINTLGQLAAVYASQGHRELAFNQYQLILKFYEISDFRSRAITFNTYANFLLNNRENERALEVSLEALTLSEKMDDKAILTPALYNLARAQLAIGSSDVALSTIRRSLEMIENLRANVASPDFRLSYLEGVGKHYELGIEILMQLEKLHPGQGFAVDGLLVSEKARARLLLDLIRESPGSRDEADQQLFDRELELRKSFQIQAEYRMYLLASRKDSAEIAVIDNQLDQLRAEYQAVLAKIWEQNPRLYSPTQPTLSLLHIQNELRDDTMLLEFALGDERSFLWSVTSNSIQHYELPARQKIEDAARELYRLTTARQGSADQNATSYQANVQAADNSYTEQATILSQMLLGQVAEQLGNKRLLVVTEGALQHISIEALPLPVAKADTQNTSPTFVIETNEVVILPSFSTLVAIRSSNNRTSSPGKLVAVIADPVFSNSDDRVKSETTTRGVALAAVDTQTSENQKRNGGFARLSYASEEADAISAVAPSGTTMVAKGFDASRELAMSAEVGQYQILHFATHGFVDSEHPELSGIVLSSVDPNGQVRNGLMPLYDIYSLDLSAELTVLSACQTALGKDIKGEGLVGLTHSFISAGSNSVAASLWKVDDRATAALMKDFYHSMLQEGMSPAAALRSAKLKMMKDSRWSEPYYWAGFVLQGEYTNRITVARNSWLRWGLILSGLLVVITAALLIYNKRRGRFLSSQST